MIPKWSQNGAKNGPGAVPEPKDSPDEPKAAQKVAEKAHRRLKQAKGNRKHDTSTPKRRRRLQKDAKRNPKCFPKDTKNVEKTLKNEPSENLFF